jgi:TolA-binding protein
MDSSNTAANVGYVLLGLASLVGLAVGVKTLFRGNGNGNGANGTHDVTRREFQEHKEMCQYKSKDLSDQLKALEIDVAVLRESLRPRLFHPHEDEGEDA